MSFEKVNVDEEYAADLHNVKVTEDLVESLRYNADYQKNVLKEAYAEIDRLTLELETLRAKCASMCCHEQHRTKPEWIPPASLRDGVYGWNGSSLAGNGDILPWNFLRKLADWIDPPRRGVWRKTGNTAEFVD